VPACFLRFRWSRGKGKPAGSECLGEREEKATCIL